MRWNDVRSELDEDVYLDCYSVSSLQKQQSVCRHVASLGHIILIFSLIMYTYRRSNKNNFVVFGLNRQGHEPTIETTEDEHASHYTRDVAYDESQCGTIKS
jgi:hypothetical protein